MRLALSPPEDRPNMNIATGAFSEDFLVSIKFVTYSKSGRKKLPIIYQIYIHMGKFAKITIQFDEEDGGKKDYEIKLADLAHQGIVGGNFGQVLKTVRKKKKVTQVQLSELSGVSTNSIMDIENGNRNTTEEMMKKLVKALGADMTFRIDVKEE